MQGTSITHLACVCALAGAACGGESAEDPPLALEPGVVVSLTFDDTWSSQLDAASVLEAHDLTGTFYVNSPRLHQAQAGTDDARYLSVADARELSLRGHEIGGHTLSHVQLPPLETAEQRREVANDRWQLSRLGFEVRSLAYPFGAVEADLAELREVVQGTGYLAARDTNGISLARCGVDGFESLPPRDPYRVRSTRSVDHVPPAPAGEPPLPSDTAETLLGWMDHVSSCGGGWLPLVFHHFRDDCFAPAAPVSHCFEYAELDRLGDALASGQRCHQDDELERCYPVSVANVGALLGGDTPAPQREPFALRNPSLERSVSSGATECIQRTQGTGGTATFARSTTVAHSGQVSERMEILGPFVAPAEIRISRDFGACSTFTSAGERYQVSLWYRADPGQPPPTLRLIVHQLSSDYVWTRIFAAPFPADASGQWVQVSTQTAPMPADTLAFSFGLRLESVGAVEVDDFALAPGEGE